MELTRLSTKANYSVKCVITGHRGGIGLETYNILVNNNYNVVGFDREDQYDLSNPTTLNLVLAELDNADVFINNAWGPESNFQTTLLKESTKKWVGLSKLIININSVAALIDQADWIYEGSYKNYRQDKLDQLEFSRKYSSFTDNVFPKIVNILPHWVNTNMVKWHDGNKLDPKVIAELILFQIKFVNDLHIKEVIINAP